MIIWSGAAPESKRGLLFAAIPATEEARLSSLLNPVKSIEDAIKVFGQPDLLTLE